VPQSQENVIAEKNEGTGKGERHLLAETKKITTDTCQHSLINIERSYWHMAAERGNPFKTLTGDYSYLQSDGERRIAKFLDDNQFKYRYEAGVLIYDTKNQPRLWYPDFQLTEYGTYVEYYGLAGNPDYRKSIRVKESVYAKNHIDVISIYPWMFREDWQGHIMSELERKIKRRYNLLKSKPYWNKTANTGYRSGQSFYRR